MITLTETHWVAGVDEAGRGPWAGPVMASAVILDPAQPIAGLADSKTLTEKKRQALACLIKEKALSWSVASASVEEIDQLNILQATLLAMQRALAGLHKQPQHALIDGNHCPALSIPAQAVIQGDRKIACISAASILAKVERDQLMVSYQQLYPAFAFHRHKGYGTAQHQAELDAFGVLPVHRKSFKPISARLAKAAIRQ